MAPVRAQAVKTKICGSAFAGSELVFWLQPALLVMSSGSPALFPEFTSSLRALAQVLELMLKVLEFLVAQVLEVHQAIARAVNGPKQLIQFQVDSLGVAVLGILDEE